jgi:hypothetical protein
VILNCQTCFRGSLAMRLRYTLWCFKGLAWIRKRKLGLKVQCLSKWGGSAEARAEARTLPCLPAPLLLAKLAAAATCGAPRCLAAPRTASA